MVAIATANDNNDGGMPITAFLSSQSVPGFHDFLYMPRIHPVISQKGRSCLTGKCNSRQAFYGKGQRVNILGFVGHVISAMTSKLFPYSMKAEI